MLRTIISLSHEDKQWLDKTVQSEYVSTAEMVRCAIRDYKKNYALPHKPPTLESLLNKTSGIWRKEDGLTFVKKLREEWEE